VRSADRPPARLHPPAGTDPASLVTAARTLVAVHNWTFLFGPDFVLGTNTVLIAYLMYRSRLVPRFIPILGLVGGPLVFAGALGVLFGAYTPVSAVAALTAVPVAAWEVCFALWLIIRGFRRASLDQLGA
jgi:ABC-type arginine transport system permease subunit